MNKAAKNFLIFYSISLALCIIASCFLTYSFLFEYDSDIQHFNYCLPVYLSFGIIALCIVAAFSTYFTVSRNSVINTENERTPFFEILTAVLSALLCALCGVLSLMEEIPAEKAYLVFIEIALYFACAVYFAVCAFANKFKNSVSYPLLNLLPICFCIIVIICRYFDGTNSMNSSELFLTILKLITFMLYFTFETALELKKPYSTRKYVFGASLVISVGGTVTLSSLATALYTYNGFEFGVLNDFLFFVIWIYIAIKSGKRTVLISDMPIAKNASSTDSEQHIRNNIDIDKENNAELQKIEDEDGGNNDTSDE